MPGKSLDQLPTREAALEWLRQLFDHLHGREVAASHALLEYIRGCTDWGFVSARKGMSNYHYVIDTAIELPDGYGVHIVIDHEFPIDEGDEPNKEVRELRAEMREAANTRGDEGRVCSEAMCRHIVAATRTAVVEQLSPEALHYLRMRAPSVSTEQLIKRHHYYWDLGEVVVEPEWGSLEWHQLREFKCKQVQFRALDLRGHSYALDVEELLARVEQRSREKLVESTVHFQEWRVLKDRAKYDTTLSDEERAAMQARAEEIIQGRHWQVLWDQEQRLMGELHGSDRWDNASIEALYELLGGGDDPYTRDPELDVYLSNVEISTRAVQGTRGLKATQSRRAIGGRGLNDQPNWE